jgi:hypothetical protein
MPDAFKQYPHTHRSKRWCFATRLKHAGVLSRGNAMENQYVMVFAIGSIDECARRRGRGKLRSSGSE